MNSEEANRIIAEYMGYKYRDGSETKIVQGEAYTRLCKYNKSLDALVPVWEKLKLEKCLCVKFSLLKNKRDFCEFNYGEYGAADWQDSIEQLGKIQEAAAIATAKAIQELQDKE